MRRAIGRALFDRHPGIIILFVLVSLSISHGLQCWTCTNANSTQHCQEIGRVRTCQTGQKNRSQCRKRPRDSICRCCCRGDRCNADNTGCYTRPRPTARGGRRSRCRQNPQAPTNGEMECSYKKYLGEINSSCMFLCHEGYVLNGQDTSTCLRRSSKSPPTFDPAPVCVPSEDALVTTRMKTAVQSRAPSTQSTTQQDTTISEDICLAIPASPALGGRSCINVNTGVVCTYFCPDGEDLIGTPVITCTTNNGWSGDPPKCGHHCEEIGSRPANGIKNCVGSGSVGTRCNFSCDPGYRLVGQTRIECVNDAGESRWNATVPFCLIDIPK